MRFSKLMGVHCLQICKNADWHTFMVFESPPPPVGNLFVLISVFRRMVNFCRRNTALLEDVLFLWIQSCDFVNLPNILHYKTAAFGSTTFVMVTGWRSRDMFCLMSVTRKKRQHQKIYKNTTYLPSRQVLYMPTIRTITAMTQ